MSNRWTKCRWSVQFAAELNHGTWSTRTLSNRGLNEAIQAQNRFDTGCFCRRGNCLLSQNSSRCYPENMVEFAGQRVRITGVSYCHFGWVLYELDGLPSHWPEAAILDQQFAEGDDQLKQPAYLTYVAAPSEDDNFVDIRHVDGRLFCAIRARDVDALVNDINRVAKLRSRPSPRFGSALPKGEGWQLYCQCMDWTSRGFVPVM